MSSPAIVHKAQFVNGSNKVFKSYIDYIDRDEATRNYKFENFSLFNDYMGNSEKSGSLFTSHKDWLNENEKSNLKEQFKIAQKNGSLMWQDVFSFDNDWLVEHGYYDDKTHMLNEEKLRSAVRRTMDNQTDKANMDTAVWSASFHYNTKHIHVHVATVELTDNPKKRGKRTEATISKMKSDLINELRHREKEYNKINELIRENIVDKKGKFLSSEDKILKEKTIELLKKLPSNRSHWHYNYNKINSLKPLINAISKHYIDTYHKEDYDKLIKRLTIEELENKRIYGTGQEGKEEGRYKNYKANKLNELNEKMGNSILKELREFSKLEAEKNKNKRNVKTKEEKTSENNMESIKCEDNKNTNEKDYKNNQFNKIYDRKVNENMKDEENNTNKNETHIEEKTSKENFRNRSKDTGEKNRKNGKEDKEDGFNKFYNEKFTSENSINNINRKIESKGGKNNNSQFKVAINRGTINGLKKALKNDVEKYINQREYEKAEKQNQKEKDYEMEL